MARISERVPYPLRPGTAEICSGECFRCGTHGHGSKFCPALEGNPARLSRNETAWRALCNRVLGPLNKNTAFRGPGKQGRVAAKDSTPTQTLGVSTIAQVAGPDVTHKEPHVIDLYSASAYESSDTNDKSVPFTHPITLMNPDGTKTSTHALFDDGAMTGAMSLTTFNTAKHSLKGWKPSTRKLHMANGVIVKSEAQWTGTINIKGVEATGSFEVFNSAGGWSFLLENPSSEPSRPYTIMQQTT